MGDIIANCIAEDIVQRLALGNIFSLLADNSDKLTLVVQALSFLRNGRDGDVVCGPGNRGDGLEEQHRVLGDGQIGLLGVLLVVQSQAADGLDILARQRSQEHAYVGDLVCDAVLAEDVALYHTRLGCLGGVTHSRGEQGVAVVDLAIFGQEADQTLETVSMDIYLAEHEQECHLRQNCSRKIRTH